MENDLIRSHSPHFPNSYTDGIVVGVDAGFITYVAVSATRDGCTTKVDEIHCAPLNGQSMFDDPFCPRIEKLGHVPSFRMTEEQTKALARFRSARDAIYPKAVEEQQWQSAKQGK